MRYIFLVFLTLSTPVWASTFNCVHSVSDLSLNLTQNGQVKSGSLHASLRWAGILPRRERFHFQSEQIQIKPAGNKIAIIANSANKEGKVAVLIHLKPATSEGHYSGSFSAYYSSELDGDSWGLEGAAIECSGTPSFDSN